jgi:hypothetical protein
MRANSPRHLKRSCIAARAALLWGCALPLAVTATAAQDASSNSALGAPARNWAVDCAKNEEQVLDHPGSYLRYRLHQVDEKGDKVRDLIETPEGSVARLIEQDGKPLTPEQDAGERARLNDLIASPETFARHSRRDEDNRKTGVEMLRQMPNAMLWSYAPGQPQFADQPASGSALVVLDFKPDPKWQAPSFESEPLTGVEGRVWIDPRARRVVRLQADVFRPVNIGWGLVAHLYPGGTVTLRQTSVGGQRWLVDHIDEKVVVRALLLKTVKESMLSDSTGAQPVPSMSYRQAIKMLLDTPLPTH